MRLIFYSLSLLILVACTRTNFNDDKYSFSQYEQGITITSDSISVRLRIYRDDIIQVIYLTGMPVNINEESFCVILKPDTNIRYRLKENEEYLRLITRKVIAEVVKDPFNINFYDRKSQPLLLGSRSYKINGNARTAFFRIQENDHSYGMEQKNIPYVYSPSGWGVFFSNTRPGYFDMGKTDPKEWYYTAEDGNFTYYFVQGDKPQDLFRKYFELTGYNPMLPKWTLGYMQNECGYENERQLDSLHRSGFAGFELNGIPTWPVDTSEQWNVFKQRIPVLPGILSDMGSYQDTLFTENAGKKILTSTELYTRWFEFSVFSPHLDPQSVEEQSIEPFAFDEMTTIITSSYLKLRYRLIPYLYSYMYKTSTTGEPLIKALFFLFDDPKAAQYQATEYMFGNEFLVAPVTEKGQVRKTIYLPQLDERYSWIDYWTDELLAGGNEYSVKVPVQEVPLFIKQPAIIPMAKLKKYVDESPDDTLTIDIYPGGHAEFLLYEDDGTTNNYLKGEHAITKLTTDKTGNNILVKIPAAEGTYPGMVEERTWLLAIHLVEGFDEILVNGNKISPVEYVRALSRNSYYYDLNNYMLVMDVGGSTGEGISVRIKRCTLIEK